MRISTQLERATVTILAGVAVLATAASAHAATEPTKFVPSLRFGEKVDKSTGANTCLVSEASCGEGLESEQPGGFSYPPSVAVAKDGNVYVADDGGENRRIQELTANGEFVLMFGWDVNKTRVKEGASQAARDVCTAAEVTAGAECLKGEAGTGESTENAGEMLKVPADVAVDQSTGDVYVLDGQYHRVDEFTEAGEFILTIGGDVNKTAVTAGGGEAERNLCTAASHDVCQAGTEGSGHGEFEPYGESNGDLLAVGGPEGFLYVGAGSRVQEFDTESGAKDGEWKGEISLSALSPTGHAKAIAVDSPGDVFVVDSGVPGVHEYNANGEQQSLVIDPNGNKEEEVNASSSFITGIALDYYGRLTVTEYHETKPANEPSSVGSIYKTSGELVGEFAFPSGNGGIPFGIALDVSSSSDQLYAAEEASELVEVYDPVVFPEVRTCPATEVLAVSATLCGSLNPNGVLAKGFFAYGPAGGRQTQTAVSFEGEGTVFEAYAGGVTGLVPNQTYQFHAVVEALAEGAEKQVAGGVQEFHTATPPPVIVAQPSASFVKAQSAVLEASLDPEHATTHYDFEYELCATHGECAPPHPTPVEASSQYGNIGFAQEITGLAPSSTYHYRLVANNEHEEAGRQQGGEVTSDEGSLTTGPPPAVAAATGPAGAVTSTSAVLAGTVDPDGQPATYAFELGVYTGAGTRYGVVFSGPAGEGTAATGESLAVTGLQPGTSYAYRIAVHSGYGVAFGAPVVFTTAGLAAVLVSPAPLPMLAVPNIAFPAETKGSTTIKKTVPKCKRGKKLSHRACVKVKAKRKVKKAKKSSRSQQANRKSQRR